MTPLQKFRELDADFKAAWEKYDRTKRPEDGINAYLALQRSDRALDKLTENKVE